MKSAPLGNRGNIIVIVLVVAAIAGVILLIPQLTKNGGDMNPTSQGSTVQSSQTPAQPGVVALMFDPATVTASVNKTFTVDVNIDTKTDTVSAVELHLAYDANYLEATSVIDGSLLPVVLTAGQVAPGSASIIVGSNPKSPYKGTGSVAKVTFTAKKAGMTQIQVDKATKIAAIGQKGNVLGSSSSTAVTIK